MPFSSRNGELRKFNANEVAEKIDLGIVDGIDTEAGIANNVYLSLIHEDNRELTVVLSPIEAGELALRILGIAGLAEVQAQQRHGNTSRH